MELLLDGELGAERTGPPWTVSCDFGPELAPHELVAVARNADGEELGRARQWVHLPPWDARTETEGAERTSVAVEVRRRGTLGFLSTVKRPDVSQLEQRLADAVAVAGMEAAGQGLRLVR